MPDLILPQSFVVLLAEFEAVFTAPSFANFLVLCSGWLHAPGTRHISDVVRAAGILANKHYCAYYRFFSHARWADDELALTFLGIVLRVFAVNEVELVLDDTLSRRTGKKVALATMHADPLLRQGGRPFHSYGHVFVVLAVHVVVPHLAATGWALPFMTRLFESSRQGGRADAPSDQRRADTRRRKGVEPRSRPRLTDRKVGNGNVVPVADRPDTGPLPDGVRPTKLQLATQMLLSVARRFPHIRFRVLADHAYCGKAVLHAVSSQVDNVTFVMRGHGNAALFDLPPQGPHGRGRPRVKGKKLLSPEQWKARHRAKLRRTSVEMYGRMVGVLLGSHVGMAYRSLPGQLVRYVIVVDPSGRYRDTYLMTTDLALSEEEVVASYARRWALELTFREVKQKLGMQDAKTQRPASVRRTAPFALLQYSLVVYWFVTAGHREARRLKRHRDLIYDKTGRPSFSDMLATLRRLGWRRGFLDPTSRPTKRSKMLEAFLDTVVAAA